MKDISYYSTNTLPYPNPDHFKVVYVYQQGKTVARVPGYKWNDVKSEYVGMVTEIVRDDAALKKARVEYGAETSRLTAEFRADLFEDNGVTDNPKAAKAYSLAWGYGHASGLGEVKQYFEEVGTELGRQARRFGTVLDTRLLERRVITHDFRHHADVLALDVVPLVAWHPRHGLALLIDVHHLEVIRVGVRQRVGAVVADVFHDVLTRAAAGRPCCGWCRSAHRRCRSSPA
jgi:hypothetical protein